MADFMLEYENRMQPVCVRKVFRTLNPRSSAVNRSVQPYLRPPQRLQQKQL